MMDKGFDGVASPALFSAVGSVPRRAFCRACALAGASLLTLRSFASQRHFAVASDVDRAFFPRKSRRQVRRQSRRQRLEVQPSDARSSRMLRGMSSRRPFRAYVHDAREQPDAPRMSVPAWRGSQDRGLILCAAKGCRRRCARQDARNLTKPCGFGVRPPIPSLAATARWALSGTAEDIAQICHRASSIAEQRRCARLPTARAVGRAIHILTRLCAREKCGGGS